MKILIVEDIALELHRLKRFVLEVCPGCDLKCFSDSGEALELVESKSFIPDVAFLDIQMPSPSGIELAELFIKEKPDINIIFTTAYSSYLQQAFDMFASGYIQKPFSVDEIRHQIEHLRFPVKEANKKFHAKTIGEFDFFCNGKPVVFSSARSKELLAYLIDRRGASVTKKELFAILFEDTEYTSSKQDYLKKIINSLKATLSSYGGEDLLIHSRNCYSVNTGLFSCDLYDMLNKGSNAASFDNYMEQYSWGTYR